jgi:hypothetical protein
MLTTRSSIVDLAVTARSILVLNLSKDDRTQTAVARQAHHDAIHY